MTQTSDIILGILAFMISLYGGVARDFTSTVLGILLISLTLTLRFHAQEEDITFLKNELHTHYAILELKMEVERLKHAKSQR